MQYIYSIRKFINNHIFTIVLCCSIFAFAFFLLSHVILTYIHQPPNTINMMVGHYFEDYYEYLSYLKQGQQGHILLNNLFSHDDSSIYFTPWWPYMLFGFISFILNLKIPPQFIYWFMSFLLISALLMATYFSITLLIPDKKNILRMLTLYLIMLSTSLFKVSTENGLKIIPIDFWYSNGNPFARYNIGTLHHQTANLVFLIGILFIIRYIDHPQRHKLTIVLLLFSFLLLSLSPPQLFLFWGAYLSSSLVYVLLKTQKDTSFEFSDSKRVTGARYLVDVTFNPAQQQGGDGQALREKNLIKNAKVLKAEDPRRIWRNLRKIFLPFSISFIFIIPFLILLKKYSLTAPAYIATTSWDTNNLYFPPLDVLTLTTGPLFILALLGLPYYFKEIYPSYAGLQPEGLSKRLRWVDTQTIPIVLGITFSKIIFFFIALLSFLSITIPFSIFGKNIFTLLGFFNLRMITPNSYIFLGVSTMFLFIKILKKKRTIFIASLVVMLLYVPSLITIWKQNIVGIYSASYLQFMPAAVYQGITSLESPNDGSVILTSPSSSLGVATPALTGRRVYLGRTFFTLDWDSKEKIARKFYTLDMSKEEAKQFLSKNNIRYIIVFQNEIDPLQMSKKYGLQSLSSNNFITILSPVVK